MVLVDSDRVSPAPPYSGYFYLINNYMYGTITLFCLPSHVVPFLVYSNVEVLQPLYNNSYRFGLLRVRSPLLAESLIVFSSSRYLDVSVPWVRFISYDMITNLQLVGLPHSDIYGSILICNSP